MKRTIHPIGRLTAAFVAVLLLTPEGRAGVSSRPVPRAHPLHGSPALTANPAAPAPTNPRLAELAAGLRRSTASIEAERRGAKTQRRLRRNEAMSSLQARTGSPLDVRIRPNAGTPMQIRGGILEPAAPAGARASQRDTDTARLFLRRNRDLLGLDDPDAELTLVERQSDDMGRRHLRFSQSFAELPVWPADVIVHLDPAGNVDLLNGAFVRTPRRRKTVPQIAATRAVEIARGVVPDGADAEEEPPQLILYAPLDRPTQLAWKVEVEVSLTSRWLVVVDARRGRVLSAFNQVNEAGRSGSGADVFGVSRPLNVWEEGGTHFLVDTSKPSFDSSSDPPDPDSTRGGIVILDARNQPPTDSPDSIPELFQVTSRNPNGPWLPDGVSAAFGLSRTYDYYRERHNRNAIDGQGGTLIGIVRYGSGLQNAFWSNGLMLFGDAQPYTGATDVVGHEMTHGVTEKTAELIYENQPGALNEAMSDIFGENVEAFTNNGVPDWLKGAQLGEAIQNFRDPNAITVLGRPLPARMSQFIPPNDPFFDNFTGRDNGGVHINSNIINHAYYLLAEGLDDGLGLRDAERIFYRALTVHLVRNSQFIDARLAAVQSAEEIFGADSRQVQRTRQAFDRVEILDAAGTPDPEPFPSVQGPDALLFTFYDPETDAAYLGRLEEELGDPAAGVQLSAFPVQAGRPSVTGDGSVAAFVDAENDVCLIATDAGFDEIEECAGVPGLVHSVAMEATGERFAFVLRDEQGEPEGSISIIDLTTEDTRTIDLGAPVIDGESVGTVAFAEIMDFTADGRFLVYDAFNVIPVADADDLGLWSVYALDLQTERPQVLVEPVPGINIGNPSLSQTSDNFMLLDVFDEESSDVYSVDLNTGDITEIDSAGASFGFPGYNGDDSAVVFSREDDTSIGSSLVQRPVRDFTIPTGNTTLVLEDAFGGVVYRRGEFQGPPPATATPTFGVPPTRTPTRTPPPLGACVGDCNLDDGVTVDELIRGVNIALGNIDIEQCDEIDSSGDGTVTVNELIQAVNSALNGCT